MFNDFLLTFFLKGVVVGIVIAVPVGPVGVLCVRRAIFDGRMAGFVSGLGAASADAVFGIVAGFGLTVVSDVLLGHQNWLRGIGGLFLLYLGASALLRPQEASAAEPTTAENVAGLFFSTFALTISNPVTILAFLGVFAAVGFSGAEATMATAAMLVAGVLTGSLAWWLGLSLGAGLFHRRFGETELRWLNRGSGAILTLSGVALLIGLAVDLARHGGS